jgi:microcystin-dependent protein
MFRRLIMSEPFLGEIRMVGFNFEPKGWAYCNGQLMSIAQNSALFALLGTTFGGDGVTTFGLPDLRGRSPVGMGTGPGLSTITQGEESGNENVTILQTQMPMHNHPLTGATAAVAIPVNITPGSSKTPSNTSVLSTTNDPVAGAEVDIYSAGPGTDSLAPFNANVNGSTATAGGSQPLAIRNPYLGSNFVIALEGIFPSRN